MLSHTGRCAFQTGFTRSLFDTLPRRLVATAGPRWRKQGGANGTANWTRLKSGEAISPSHSGIDLRSGRNAEPARSWHGMSICDAVPLAREPAERGNASWHSAIVRGLTEHAHCPSRPHSVPTSDEVRVWCDATVGRRISNGCEDGTRSKELRRPGDGPLPGQVGIAGCRKRIVPDADGFGAARSRVARCGWFRTSVGKASFRPIVCDAAPWAQSAGALGPRWVPLRHRLSGVQPSRVQDRSAADQERTSAPYSSRSLTRRHAPKCSVVRRRRYPSQLVHTAGGPGRVAPHRLGRGALVTLLGRGQTPIWRRARAAIYRACKR